MSMFVVLVGGLIAAIVFSMQLPVGVAGAAGIALITYAFVSYWLSTSIVLSISGAHEVTKEEEWEFVRRVENLSIGAGLPMPKTWVLEDSAPNAFATGRDPQHSHVVVTRGLLDKLEPSELEGVLAHELSHIGNYDIRVMTIVTVLVGVVALISDVFLRLTWFGAGSRRGSKDKGGGALALIMLAVAILGAILAPLIAQIIRLAVSRRREYLADASGALLCRNPEALASALEKISGDPEPLEAANKATAHLYISNPLKEHQSFLNNLFNTHPPIEDRIRLLRSM
ncbi:MAG: M48 family metallopeptidase [Dehalococcoidia bacterium]|nr:MAG: zinc metalloprotease HtpX [bacterium]MCE7927084.1 zinc metalloprotease HtpX [Chloroflexi bacterium CFX7]MCL4231734.1 M48 family metallopeptidase [Dehalococcoidia bacterium]NUQ56202.1 M48 family metallopeptidase [Dehalococcoidia bacterium]RIL03411.1 MAG: zinc metalloprotease HtpX [bacterium]